MVAVFGNALRSVRVGAACLLFAAVCCHPLSALASDDVRWHDTVTLAAGKAEWGRLARLQNSSWLAVNTRYPTEAETTLAVSISTDNARSWSPISSLAEPGRKLDNGELRVLPDGRILLAMRSLIDGKSYRLNLYRSEDKGRTWRFLSTIDRNEAPGGRGDRGLWEPMLATLPDGALSVVYADETYADARPAYSQVISQRISLDGGASWGPKIRIVTEPGGGAARPGMPVMTRLRDGRYLLVFEICGGDPHCPVSFKRSPDGKQWLPGLGAPMPYQNCGPHVLATAEGRLFASSCQNEIVWSDDDGRHWRRNDPPAWPFGFRHSWPALYQIGPGEIAVVNGVESVGLQIRFGSFSAANAR